MIAFLIFYFVFTGIITIGVLLYKDEEFTSIVDYIPAFLFGCIVVPLGIGALMAKFASNDIIVKIKKNNE